MSVEKFTVTTESTNYTTIPTVVLRKLKHLDALGLWCNFISRPPTWEFYKDEIYAHFGIGRDKLKKLLKILTSCNLITVTQKRNDKGVFEDCDIHVKNGSEFTPLTENTFTEPSTCLPATANQLLVNSTYKEKKKKRKIEPKKDFILPNWINPKDWNDFVQLRIEIKAPLSDIAMQRAISTLTTLKEKGENISDVFNQTILNGWKGFFPVRKNSQGSNYANKRKSNSAIHFDSVKGSLEGTIYEQDPFSEKTS